MYVGKNDIRGQKDHSQFLNRFAWHDLGTVLWNQQPTIPTVLRKRRQVLPKYRKTKIHQRNWTLPTALLGGQKPDLGNGSLHG